MFRLIFIAESADADGVRRPEVELCSFRQTASARKNSARTAVTQLDALFMHKLPARRQIPDEEKLGNDDCLPVCNGHSIDSPGEAATSDHGAQTAVQF
ncbi:MAG: hypothetical protein HQ518_16175, partial [Rhodopirellula sp.]|nr:hypothetical protein [Rhodopirellula sp.]